MTARSRERELSPPAFLQLAGHPLRWRLLGELARSDRLVSELTGLVGQPQNLVSYHLGKLRDGRLVSARRSSADGRDAYYAVDLARMRELLSSTGSALHPGLDLAAVAPDGEAEPHAGRGEPHADGDRPRPVDGERWRILFLCTGNSSRSQMAEALVRHRSAGAVEAFSAGSRPKDIHPAARRVMRQRGIDLAGHVPKHLDVFADERFDRVITLCDRVREVCPEFPGQPEAVHWSIPDPAAAGDEAGDAPFEQTAAELETRVGFLLAGLGRSANTTRAARRGSPEEEP